VEQTKLLACSVEVIPKYCYVEWLWGFAGVNSGRFSDVVVEMFGQPYKAIPTECGALGRVTRGSDERG
jgi:hypothetical protein